EPVQFESIVELRHFAEAKGLKIHYGNSGDIPGGSCYVAAHPMTFQDLIPVSRHRNLDNTTAWSGIVWVCKIQANCWTLCPDEFDGNGRIWGNLFVVGDKNLMDRIETLYRAG